jgi:hypothetical protein
MTSRAGSSTFDIEQPNQRSSATASGRFAVLRRIPLPWLIAAIVFYCASLLTVGLLAGLLPGRTKYITIIATTPEPLISSTAITTAQAISTTTTATQSISTTSTTTVDPLLCVDDECNPRLSSDIRVRSYDLEYHYNDTCQTTAQGTVTITFDLKQPIKQLIYHAKRMVQLDPPALFEDGVNRLVSVRTYAPHDYISLRLANNDLFAPNQYRLIQKFVVNLTDGNTGFYQSTYLDEDGSTK